MKELIQSKYLIGVAIIFWLSLYLVVSLQAKVEVDNHLSTLAELSYNLQ